MHLRAVAVGLDEFAANEFPFDPTTVVPAALLGP